NTTNTIPFTQFGPVLDAIILALPKEDPLSSSALSVDGAPLGPNGVKCSGVLVPAAHISITGASTICQGLTTKLNAEIDGSTGAGMTYKWRLNSVTGTIESTNQ